MNAGRALLLTVVCAAPLAGEAQARAGQAGVVVGWGTTYMPPVEAGTRFRAVTAQVGELAITSDGTVVAWGGESAGWAVPAGPERRHRHRRGRLEQRGIGRRSGADAPGAAAGRPGAVTLNGIPGWRYTVSGSTDLVNWTPLTAFVATNGATQIVDPAAGGLSHRFYRATAP